MISLNSNSISSAIARNLNQNAADLQKVTQQISSGKRILSAADDAAGTGILSSLKNQMASSTAVDKNLSAGNSLLGVADKALGTQQKILSSMRDLATQASSELLSAEQRSAIQSSFAELQTQLDSTVSNAKMFGKNLLNSSATDVKIQSGINSGDTYTLKAAKSDAATLGVNAATIDLTDATKATAAMTAIDTATGTVGANQSTIGTLMNGMRQIGENNKTFQTNLTDAISKIEDADIPELSNKLTQLQSKQQLLSSTLGLSNSMPQYLLSLIRG
jgi:flagellin